MLFHSRHHREILAFEKTIMPPDSKDCHHIVICIPFRKADNACMNKYLQTLKTALSLKKPAKLLILFFALSSLSACTETISFAVGFGAGYATHYFVADYNQAPASNPAQDRLAQKTMAAMQKDGNPPMQGSAGGAMAQFPPPRPGGQHPGMMMPQQQGYPMPMAGQHYQQPPMAYGAGSAPQQPPMHHQQAYAPTYPAYGNPQGQNGHNGMPPQAYPAQGQQMTGNPMMQSQPPQMAGQFPPSHPYGQAAMMAPQHTGLPVYQ
jgi:hypothetical protein